MLSKIRTPKGEHETTLLCKIKTEDINDDGTIEYPPSGECNCMRCGICGVSVKDGSELRDHMIEKHPDRDYGR